MKLIFCLHILTTLSFLTLNAQTPTRVTPIKVQPKTKIVTQQKSADTMRPGTPIVRQTTPTRSDKKATIRNSFSFLPKNSLYTELLKTKKITLLAGEYMPIDPDVHQYYFAGSDMITYSDQKKWEIGFLWRNIASGIYKARYEISELPFPQGIQKDFGGIVLSGVIERPKNSADSFAFKLSYENVNDNSNAKPKYELSKIKPVHANKPFIQNASISKSFFINGRSNLNKNIRKSVTLPKDESEGNTTLYLSNLSVLNAVSNFGKYFVRIIPLDANNDPITTDISNTVVVKYETPLTFTAPPPSEELKLYNDYTITSFKYTQPHFAEAEYELCNVITGYNEAIVNSSPLYSNIKSAFPVGTIMCPQPEKDKSFFDKAFNGIGGAVKAVINGVAKVYSDTKNFAKNNLQSAVCGSNETCKSAVGIGFDVAMAYAGLPPSLPNFDEMAQMAEGQLVDNAVAIAEEKTGIPCPDAVKEKMKEELHKSITTSSQTNMVDNGFMHFKPDPRGQYREGYIEIEITRTNNTYQGQPKLFKLGFYNTAEKSFQDYSHILKQSYTANISASVYETGTLIIPYMPNIGDKTKLILVLKPKRLFIHTNDYDGKISRIDESSWDYDTQWHSVEYPVDMGQLSPGFQLLFLNSNNKFSVTGLKAAPGVQMDWQNH
ncbi:hypothetical protein ACQ33O_04205 [Ferruginibacter sp. SUN002]|uniref:hypothetical protein n=1 Tax=Ferruginibacter sp. SUN002 TaxID=2937789 RepID=UPI003D362F90